MIQDCQIGRNWLFAIHCCYRCPREVESVLSLDEMVDPEDNTTVLRY